MIDRRRIVRQWREGQASALVTLVRIEGSSYRRTGAHMLVTPQGESIGTISGGCLESEVVRKAAWSVRNGPAVQRYSTLFDDTAEIPYGLGCGGIVDLLVEPADTPECAALLAAMEHSLTGLESTVITQLPSAGVTFARIVLDNSSKLIFATPALSEVEGAQLLTSAHTPDAPQSEHIFVERLTTPQRLLVLGAGDDAKPVVTLAALLGWDVSVLDGRAQLARAERFPEARAVKTLSSTWNNGETELALSASDAAVLMSHSYEQDRAALQHLLSGLATGAPGRVPGYIGLLGARHRSSLLISEAAAALGVSVADCCERVWAPVGLDLGGDGPQAVALAIVAEVQSWINGRLARSRRLNMEEVAEQIKKGGASAYLNAHCAVELARP